jgi:hypothetical protein
LADRLQKRRIFAQKSHKIGDTLLMKFITEAMIERGESSHTGYPACPDHLEKPIWKLLNVEQRIGVTVEEYGDVARFFRFWILFWKPEVSVRTWKIKEDQVIGAWRRKRFGEVAMKWLRSNNPD